jgi:hemerythrin-like domain-containing protein
MTDTKNLIRQHNDILDIAAQILTYKTNQQISDNAFNITLLIGQLAGKLKVHMTTEDKFVYPALTLHPDIKVQKVSRMFSDEMGDLAKVFESYKTKYLSSRQISTDPNLFSLETKAIFAAITKRIEKENTQLYPLLSS